MGVFVAGSYVRQITTLLNKTGWPPKTLSFGFSQSSPEFIIFRFPFEQSDKLKIIIVIIILRHLFHCGGQIF